MCVAGCRAGLEDGLASWRSTGGLNKRETIDCDGQSVPKGEQSRVERLERQVAIGIAWLVILLVPRWWVPGGSVVCISLRRLAEA